MPQQAPHEDKQSRKTGNFKLDAYKVERRDLVGPAGQVLLLSLIESGLSKGADSLHLYIHGDNKNEISCYFHHSKGLIPTEKKFSPTILIELVGYLKEAANLELHQLSSVQSAQFSLPQLPLQKLRLTNIRNPDSSSEHLILHFQDKKTEPLKLSEVGLSPENLEHYKQILSKGQGIVVVGSNDTYNAQSFISASLKSLCAQKNCTVLSFDSSPSSTEDLSQFYDRVFSPIDSQNLPIIKNALSSGQDIVVFRDPANSHTLQFALQQASSGKLVFVVTNITTVGDALKMILSLSADPKGLIQNISAVVSLTAIRSIKSSSANHDLTDSLLDQLESYFGIDGRGGWEDLFAHAKLNLSEPILPIASEYGPLTNLVELLDFNEELKNSLTKNSSVDSEVITWLATRSGMLTRRHDGLVRSLQAELDVADVVNATS